jgi:hypothetical protein
MDGVAKQLSRLVQFKNRHFAAVFGEARHDLIVGIQQFEDLSVFHLDGEGVLQ